MKGLPIHENLSTSFVDLTALVRHLRGLQFTGFVRVELSSYEAEIIFTPSNKIQAREYDKLAGRIAQGEHAFRRILVRAREPFGRIHVLRVDPSDPEPFVRRAFVDDRIAAGAREAALGNSDRFLAGSYSFDQLTSAGTPDRTLTLANDLILTVKEAFAKTRINFDVAFENACASVSGRHHFLDPHKGRFRFENDTIKLSDRMSSIEVFDGVVDALRHMLKGLMANPKLTKFAVYTRHTIQQHLSTRHNEYQELRLVRSADRLFVD